jgi:PIN domain nuclease of toxin-antitoxin system
MPGVIADTHALIWYLLDSPRLSARASAQLERFITSDATIGVSSISIVEIIYLLEKDRIPLEALTLLKESLAQEPKLLEIVPVTYAIALTTSVETIW